MNGNLNNKKNPFIIENDRSILNENNNKKKENKKYQEEEQLSSISKKFNFVNAQKIDNKIIITNESDLCGDKTKKTLNFWYNKFTLFEKKILSND